MAYSRYFAIKSGSDSSVTRDISGATEVLFTLLGRERGGLCSELQAAVPSLYPDKRGVKVNDFVLAGYDSSAANHWFHGYITRISHSPSDNLLRINAVGFEEQLKNIKPRVNYGADPGNPYATYDNESTVRVSGSSSVVEDLYNNYIKANYNTLQGINAVSTSDIDGSSAGTDIEFLQYDGSVSLYDILNSLAERTGFSWGFYPTATSMENHRFFFKDVDAAYTPGFSKFVYGGSNPSCISIETLSDEEQYINDLNVSGSYIPQIGESISRNYVDDSQSDNPVNSVTRSVPGYRTTNDIKVHAQAILDRRREPGDTFKVVCIQRDSTHANIGQCFYPGRTKIKVVDTFEQVFNDSEEKFLTQEIKVTMLGHAIQLEFQLGEMIESTRSLNFGADNKSRPALSFTYDGLGTFNEVTSWRNPNLRWVYARKPAKIIGLHATEDKATIQITEDADAVPEIYTDIPLPTGTTLADWAVNDELDFVENFLDQELDSVNTAQQNVTGGTGVDTSNLLNLMRLYMANGLVGITNNTPFIDVGADGGGFSEGATGLVPGNGTYPEARLGYGMRVPQDDILALSNQIHAIISASYNTTGLTLPGTTAQAKLFSRVLGLTSSGQVGLGDISGSDIIVIVKTAAGQIRNMYLTEANDPPTAETVAAPRGAATRSNTA